MVTSPGPSLWRNREFQKLWTGEAISSLGDEVSGLAFSLLAVLTLHDVAARSRRISDTPSMPPTIVEYRGHRVIRDFWEWYTEFPELYDRFSLSSVPAIPELDAILGFAGMRVVNVASGTGRDTFEIASRADEIIGVEPADTMRAFSVMRRLQLGIDNVRFVAGVAERLPFRDRVFGCALSIHGAPFVEWDREAWSVRECIRVVRPEGWVAFVSSPDPDSHLGRFVQPFGFEFHRMEAEIDYGSIEEALATWGCITGEEAIDQLLDEQTSKVTVGLGIWYRNV